MCGTRNLLSKETVHVGRAKKLDIWEAYLELCGSVPKEGSFDVFRDRALARLHEVLVLRVHRLVSLPVSIIISTNVIAI